MNFIINKTWQNLLQDTLNTTSFNNFKVWLENEYKTKTIYPKFENIFTALNLVEPKDVKVVIIGQDPYHGEGQAHGLSFSVENNVKLPKSLVNIFKELQLSFGGDLRQNGNLTDWAEQGVLMLNAVLTVEQSKPNSHESGQWQMVTQKVVEIVNQECENVVFLLWGSFAGKYEGLLNKNKHFVIKSPHPSPLSAYRGWFGCDCFKQANSLLMSKGKAPINWL